MACIITCLITQLIYVRPNNTIKAKFYITDATKISGSKIIWGTSLKMPTII